MRAARGPSTGPNRTARAPGSDANASSPPSPAARPRRFGGVLVVVQCGTSTLCTAAARVFCEHGRSPREGLTLCLAALTGALAAAAAWRAAVEARATARRCGAARVVALTGLAVALALWCLVPVHTARACAATFAAWRASARAGAGAAR